MKEIVDNIIIYTAAFIAGAILGHLSSKWAGKRWGIDGCLVAVACWCIFTMAVAYGHLHS